MGEAAAPIPIRAARFATHNLPASFTSFIGREHDRAEVSSILRGQARLVTLTGSGGIGKTRLACEVSADLLDDFRDGVWLVELAPLTHGRRVAHATAAALGVHEEPGRDLDETLVAALRPRHLLLVLDNCEHLLEASAALAHALLAGCPQVTILATSRQPLGLAGEATWRVPSLDRPDPGPYLSMEQLFERGSVRLFAERASAAAPGFRATDHPAAIAQICRRLDGIPLALELAAARVSALDPQHIAARLDDRFRLLASASSIAPPRQQTLRAAIDWSFDLLIDAERRLFERLAVFSGGWTLEAAEAICNGDPIAEHDVADLLSRLVDRSLVIVEEVPLVGRWYRLLETMRAYALERLRESGLDTAVQSRHLAWYAEFAQHTDRVMRRDPDVPWCARADGMQRVLREMDNLRAAFQWSVGGGDAEQGMRLAALLPFFYTAGFLSEGRDWMAQLLHATAGAPATPARALALSAAGKLAAHHGDDVATFGYFAEYQRLPSALQPPAASGDMFAGLAIVEARRGDFERARTHALAAVEQAVSIDDPIDAAIYRTYAATAAFAAGQRDDAVAMYRQSLAEARALDFQLAIALALDGLATIALASGESAEARRLYAEALIVFRAMGAVLPGMHALIGSGHAALDEGDVPGAGSDFGEALDMSLAVGQRQQVVNALDGLVLVAAAQRRHERVVRLVAASDSVRAASGGVPLGAVVRAAFDEARRHLGHARADAIAAQGQAMSVDQAITCAREVDDAQAVVRLGPGGLTGREVEVVRLLGRGLSNRAIATELVISVRTVDRHVENVLDKLALTSRGQIVAWAHEHDVLRRGTQAPV